MNTHKAMSKGKVVRPCSKHSKTKTTVKASCTHIPTVKCHEEIMRRLSPYFSRPCEECIGEPACNTTTKSQFNKVTNQDKRKKGNNSKPVHLKSKTRPMYESASAPLNLKERHVLPESSRSKSSPMLHNASFEDSVDFIPVKLLSNNDAKQRPKDNKRDLNTVGLSNERASCRATWDKLLKGDVKNRPISQNSKPKNKVSSSTGRSSTSRPTTDESSPNTPKKKVSISVSNTKNIQSNVNIDDLPKISSDKELFNQLYGADPLKTLDFLIKKLREKLTKQPENDNLQNIILDMENALLKISYENYTDTKSTIGKTTDKEYSSDIAPKTVLSDGLFTEAKKGHLDIAQLQKGLQESCLFLQSLCIKQRESCNNHLREKEQLTIQLAESRRLLAIAKSREKDYEVTIGELRLKMQEFTTRKDQLQQPLLELTDTVAKLKAENEVLKSLKDSLNSKLREISREKEILRSKLHLKELEIEKFKVLLEVKENLNPASGHKKNEKFNGHEDNLNLDLPLADKENSIPTLSSANSWREKPGLACSSQASSSPRRSPSPYNSWQHISDIYQHPPAASHLIKGIADIFHNAKKMSEQNEPPPSSCTSLWSDKEDDINSNLVFSDCASGTMSS